MALLAALVIFTVIARYCFSLSWKQLAEFNTTLFAFTTFWGMGINVIKDEHVMIDIIYDGVKPARKRWLAIVNYLIVLPLPPPLSACGRTVWYSPIRASSMLALQASRSVRAWRSP